MIFSRFPAFYDGA